MEDGNRCGGPLGDVTLPQIEPHDVSRAQPILQTVDEGAKVRRGRPQPAGGERDLLRRQRLGDGRGQNHRLDPETGVETFEALGEQAEKMIGIPHRAAGADRRPAHLAIDVIEVEHELVDTEMLAPEPTFELAQQPPESDGDVRVLPQRLGRHDANPHRQCLETR